MTRRILASILLAGLIAGSVAMPATAKKKKQPAVVTVAEDPKGDWGANSDPTVAPTGDELGSDFVGAEITMADKSTVNFVLKLNKLPTAGGTPEGIRYIWSLTIDGEYAELDGKFTNYSRGACDPTAQSCPPPRDPGSAPFAVRGDCTVVESVSTCIEKGLVHATFNADDGSITIPVPLELIGAKSRSKIAVGTSEFTTSCGGTIIAIMSTFLSFCGGAAGGAYPNDTMFQTGTFVVP